MAITIRFVLGVLALLLVLAGLGAGYQWVESRADRDAFPPPGRLVDVDGLMIHLDCRGSGRPVVLLEAGLTSGSSTWGLVHDALSRTTEVCGYDRPGLDWSEPLGRSMAADEVADRLHALVDAAAIEGPYVLLGMSAGGVYVREYVHRYPDGVAGMVLVDSSHEQQRDRLPTAGNQADLIRMVTLCRWLQPVGVVRLIGALDDLVDQPTVPESLRPVLRANFNQSHYCASVAHEMAGFTADLGRSKPPRPLGDLPLTVLSQGIDPMQDEIVGVSPEQAQAMRVVWDEMQLELAALSSRGQRLIAERSGHMIQLQQPELVIHAVDAMIRSLRSADRSAPPASG